MNCDHCQLEFAASLEDLLEGGASAEFSAHLSGCPGCRSAYEETRRLVLSLRSGSPAGVLPSIASSVADGIIREQSRQLRRVSAMRRRLVGLSAAAVLLAGLGVLSNAFFPRLGRQARAGDLSSSAEVIKGVRSATWTMSYYKRFTDPGGTRRRWVRVRNNDQRLFYLAPGRYRRENIDEDGRVNFVAIEDVRSKTSLEINPATRVATLRYLAESSYSPSGPFTTFLESIKAEELRALGGARIDGRQADGYRRKFFVERGNQPWSYDFWVDSRSRGLLEQRIPGADLFDPRDVVTDKTCAVSAESVEVEGERYGILYELGFGNGGSVLKDVALDAAVDPSLFRLDPPEGYEFSSLKLPPIAEGDVVEFLGLVAGYFGGSFPASVLDFNAGAEYPRFERIEHDWIAKKKGGTQGEIALVEAMHKWWRRGIPGPGPLLIYKNMNIDKGSWKYLGEGVRLGQKDRIVCWYRPEGSAAYHVVYGDLTVREVEARELPLSVGR